MSAKPRAVGEATDADRDPDTGDRDLLQQGEDQDETTGDDADRPPGERQVARATAAEAAEPKQPLADAVGKQRGADDQPEDEFGPFTVRQQVRTCEDQADAFDDQDAPVCAAPRGDAVSNSPHQVRHRQPSLCSRAA